MHWRGGKAFLGCFRPKIKACFSINARAEYFDAAHAIQRDGFGARMVPDAGEKALMRGDEFAELIIKQFAHQALPVSIHLRGQHFVVQFRPKFRQIEVVAGRAEVLSQYLTKSSYYPQDGLWTASFVSSSPLI